MIFRPNAVACIPWSFASRTLDAVTQVALLCRPERSRYRSLCGLDRIYVAVFVVDAASLVVKILVKYPEEWCALLDLLCFYGIRHTPCF